MVTTRSRVLQESDEKQFESFPHKQAGREGVETVSRVEFEELRRQNEEMGRTLREMMKMMRGSIPQPNVQTGVLEKETIAHSGVAGQALGAGAGDIGVDT